MVNTLLFADDQIITQETECHLQKALYKLHLVCQEYNFSNQDEGNGFL